VYTVNELRQRSNKNGDRDSQNDEALYGGYTVELSYYELTCLFDIAQLNGPLYCAFTEYSLRTVQNQTRDCMCVGLCECIHAI